MINTNKYFLNDIEDIYDCLSAYFSGAVATYAMTPQKKFEIRWRKVFIYILYYKSLSYYRFFVRRDLLSSVILHYYVYHTEVSKFVYLGLRHYSVSRITIGS